MASSVSEQCRSCISTLRAIFSTLSASKRHGRVTSDQANEQLERFSLWVGNIGALHRPASALSIESRLREAEDVLAHIVELLDDLNEVTNELSQITSGKREGEVSFADTDECTDGDEVEEVAEESELLEEIGDCVTRLFRVSSLIRQAAPTDLFAKALLRNRYRFNDQFDIAHVGEKFPKLASQVSGWLRERLGRAITRRRQYLSYIQDHRDKLEGMLTMQEPNDAAVSTPEIPVIKHLHTATPVLDTTSRPSTFFTKATSLAPGRITAQMLTAEEESDPENDARSYTTVSRSMDGDIEASTMARIPRLDDLRVGSKKEVECPFCFRMKKFKNERVWRRHVFSDLRSYVCTFQDCDAPYFGDINEWFHHEMQNHRVSYLCRLCKGKTFHSSDRYLAHVKRHHPQLLENGDERPLLEISRKPVDQIPAHDCPCCSEWEDRLKHRATTHGLSMESPDSILTVFPTDFKRHLASHLEQLALFSIPVGSASGDDVGSNVAIEEEKSTLSDRSNLSALTFDSDRHSSNPNLDRDDEDTHRYRSDEDPELTSEDHQAQNQPSSELPDMADNLAVARTGLKAMEATHMANKLPDPVPEHPDFGVDKEVPCVYCNEPEDNDPSPEFELVLSCEVCGDMAHRQCARGAGTFGPDDDHANVWRCTACVHPGKEPQGHALYMSDEECDAIQQTQSAAIGEEDMGWDTDVSFETNIKNPVNLVYEPVRHPFKVRGKEDYLSDSMGELSFRKGQSITVTHHTPSIPEKEAFFGYYRKNGTIETGAFHKSAVAVEFGAIAKSDFFGTSDKSSLAFKKGQFINVTWTEEQMWRGWYSGEHGEKIRGRFPSHLVQWLSPADTSVSENAEGDQSTARGRIPGPFSQPVYEPVASLDVVAKHKTEPAFGSSFLYMEPGDIITVTHVIRIESEERYYSGYSTSQFGASLDGIFHKASVVPRISVDTQPTEGEWDNGRTLCVFVSDQSYPKLQSVALRWRLRELAGLYDGQISWLPGSSEASPRLQLHGTSRFVLFKKVLRFGTWAIDPEFQAFEGRVVENFGGESVDDMPLRNGELVGVLNYGPTKDWFMGIVPGDGGIVKQTGKFPARAVERVERGGAVGSWPPTPFKVMTLCVGSYFTGQTLTVTEVNGDLITAMPLSNYTGPVHLFAAQVMLVEETANPARGDFDAESTIDESAEDKGSETSTLSLCMFCGEEEEPLYLTCTVCKRGAHHFCTPRYVALDSMEDWACPTCASTDHVPPEEVIAEVRRRNDMLHGILDDANIFHTQLGNGVIEIRLEDNPDIDNSTLKYRIHSILEDTKKDFDRNYAGLHTVYRRDNRCHGRYTLVSGWTDRRIQRPIAETDRIATDDKMPNPEAGNRLPDATSSEGEHAFQKESKLGEVGAQGKTVPRSPSPRGPSDSSSVNPTPGVPAVPKDTLPKVAKTMEDGTLKITKVHRALGERYGESHQATSASGGAIGGTGQVSEERKLPDNMPAWLRLSRKEIAAKYADLGQEERKRLFEAVEAGEDHNSHWDVPPVSLVQDRNRYVNVYPFEFNRVRLRLPEERGTYINASHIVLKQRTGIQQRFIAAQAPKSNNEGISSFWQMIIDACHKDPADKVVIIMLGQHSESGIEKCAHYFPEYRPGMSPTSRTLDLVWEVHLGLKMHVAIVLKNFETSDRLRSEVRELSVENALSPLASADGHVSIHPAASVQHYLYGGWPDRDVPIGADRDALVRLARHIRELATTTLVPPIVHGSAGVGRTGTLIALDYLLYELDRGAFDPDPQLHRIALSPWDDPIYAVVDELRKQRMFMVQGEVQYALLYEILREEWISRWKWGDPDAALEAGYDVSEPDYEDKVRDNARYPWLGG